MIACIVEDIHNSIIEVAGDQYTHLASSLRVNEGDAVLAMNGVGQTRECIVKEVKKRSLLLESGNVEDHSRKYLVDLILSPPKRDSLNDCLRAACEMGVRNIYIYYSEYCQNRKVDLERSQKIINSSLVQSNNPFMPKIQVLKSIDSLSGSYENAFLFHLTKDGSGKPKDLLINEKKDQLFIMGPEGGFSERDIAEFRTSIKAVRQIKLPSPILRTHTALCAALGWFFAKI